MPTIIYKEKPSARCSCVICKKEYSIKGINSHYITAHTEAGNNKVKNAAELAGKRINNIQPSPCPHCKKDFKGLLYHIKYCKDNPNRDIHPSFGKPGTNVYLKAKELGLPKPEISEQTRLKISANSKNQIWTDERRKNHSETMKIVVKENPNSYNKNNVSGRVKLIEYNGTSLKGTWELKTAIWLDSLNVSWNHEVNPQKYYWNDDWHLYFPDFYLEKYNAHIEVKGYKTKRDDAKWAQFNGTLAIIDKNNIQILDSYKSIEHFIESCKL